MIGPGVPGPVALQSRALQMVAKIIKTDILWMTINSASPKVGEVFACVGLRTDSEREWFAKGSSKNGEWSTATRSPGGFAFVRAMV